MFPHSNDGRWWAKYYKYELTAASAEKEKSDDEISNALLETTWKILIGKVEIHKTSQYLQGTQLVLTEEHTRSPAG